MWSAIAHVGIAQAGLDFTQEFSVLGIGLLGLVWVSVGMIIALAVQHYRSYQYSPEKSRTTGSAIDYQEAA